MNPMNTALLSVLNSHNTKENFLKGIEPVYLTSSNFGSMSEQQQIQIINVPNFSII